MHSVLTQRTKALCIVSHYLRTHGTIETIQAVRLTTIYGQFASTTPTRRNSTQLLANNASSVHSNVTSQCWWRHCIVTQSRPWVELSFVVCVNRSLDDVWLCWSMVIVRYAGDDQFLHGLCELPWTVGPRAGCRCWQRADGSTAAAPRSITPSNWLRTDSRRARGQHSRRLTTARRQTSHSRLELSLFL